MSHVLSELAIAGAQALMAEACEGLKKTIEKHAGGASVGFEGTAYALPVTLALTGIAVSDTSTAQQALAAAESLLDRPDPHAWAALEIDPAFVPMLGAGRAALVAAEVTAALGLAHQDKSAKTDEKASRFIGFPSDAQFRSLGVRLVDGRIPVVAAVVGAPSDPQEAVAIAQALQQRNILTFLASRTGDRTMTDQLAGTGRETGWETLLVPLGPSTASAVHTLGFAARAAMTFGGIAPGGPDATGRILDYCRARVNAFVLALGSDDLASEQGRSDASRKVAIAAGALNFGIPTITDAEIPEILEHGLCVYEALVSGIPLDRIVAKALEVRGIKLTVTEIPIPVPYGAGFEGERVRREQSHAEFGGNRSIAFELLRGRPMDAIEDGQVRVLGPDIDTLEPGSILPLGTLVEVAGRDFREDFESVLERRVHEFAGWTSGFFHMGQRATVWIRISKEAFAQGFRLAHYGEVLIAKLREEFGALLDKIQVTLITDDAALAPVLAEAQETYRRRDERIQGMADEDTDTYYSCTLCQSFAPDHVCIVTPERPGLCGAYTWLDCAASHEIHPRGPNQPVPKAETLDPVKGQWRGVNDFLAVASNGSLDRFSAYSIMEDPMTSCGCFECIAAIVPEANGVMIVNREFPGMTPVGMTFSTMAGQIGGGIQTPGFLGIGRLYIGSRKFISAEGGIARVVWMPAELKAGLQAVLEARATEAGYPALVDKIATEFDATTPDELLEYLERVSHPALTLDALF